MTRRLSPSRLGIVCTALIAIAAALFLALRPGGPVVPERTDLPPGGPIVLTDQTGAPFDSRTRSGDVLVLYFGFTYCPDICPTSLLTLTTVLEAMGPAAQAVQPILISVDPERDTPEVLASYVRYFHPRMIGLTGTAQEIEALKRQYAVYARKVPISGGTDYTMDHTSLFYVIGADGALRERLSPYAPPAQLAARITAYVEEARPRLIDRITGFLPF